MISLVENWLKSALLEVQEYVKLSLAAIRGSFSRPFYFHDVSNSSGHRRGDR